MRMIRTLSIAVAMLALGVLGVRWYHSGYYEIVGKCKQIQLGVSKEEVITALGNPDTTRYSDRKGRETLSLEYAAPSIMATAPFVLIDKLSGRVTEVVCDDAYHLQDQN